MPDAGFRKYTLYFKSPAVTSRGSLLQKDSWIIRVGDDLVSSPCGIGECSPIPGLSIDDQSGFEIKLTGTLNRLKHGQIDMDELNDYPSIRFGLETALKDYSSGGSRVLFPSGFTGGGEGIRINGLIWMGDIDFMKKQVREKLEAGYRCIKIKVGAVDFDEELQIIRSVREKHNENIVQIRLDANGAFPPDKAMAFLEKLSPYNIHSIEQPIAAGNYALMNELCRNSPIPIALDEELIGNFSIEEKRQLLNEIKPHYIILKPGLLGGFSRTEEWMDIAGQLGTGWWITSALESNIGLNAIAQWTYKHDHTKIHGLGTGQIYENNIKSPLYLRGDELFYDPHGEWGE